MNYLQNASLDDDDTFDQKYVVSGPTPPVKFKHSGASTTTHGHHRDIKNNVTASYENVLSKMKPNSGVSSQVALSMSNNSSPICQAKKKSQTVAQMKASADRPSLVTTSIENNSFVIRTVVTNNDRPDYDEEEKNETLQSNGNASTAIIAMRQEK